MNEWKFSKTLVKLRGKESLENVAKAIGISEIALSMYEKGIRVPRDEIKMKLASYYHEDVNIFF